MRTLGWLVISLVQATVESGDIDEGCPTSSPRQSTSSPATHAIQISLGRTDREGRGLLHACRRVLNRGGTTRAMPGPYELLSFRNFGREILA